MIFSAPLAEKILAGQKTVTRRLVSANPRSPWWLDRCAHQPGSDFAICPGRGKPAVARAVVVSVHQGMLGWLQNDAEARAEGFADAAAFREAWKVINGRYEQFVLVWRIEFSLLDDDALVLAA